MYKRLIILSAIILAALCGLVCLGYYSVQIWARGMEGTRLGEFAAVAEQVRRDVNRKLDEFMAREESRPYTEYQNYYVPDNTVANQQQMPVLRSPLAGKLGQGLAYGQFQIDPNGEIITPNDDIQLVEFSDSDGDLIVQVDLNVKNVRDNLLPALSNVDASSLTIGTDLMEDVSLGDRQVYRQIQAIANEDGQKRVSKSKPAMASPGKNFPIESFNNPEQKTQVLNRSRALVEQDFLNNSFAIPEQQISSQSSQTSVQAESEESLQVIRPAAVAADAPVAKAEDPQLHESRAILPQAKDAETLSSSYRTSRAKKEIEDKEAQQPTSAPTQLPAGQRAARTYSRDETASSSRTQPNQSRQRADLYYEQNRSSQPQQQLHTTTPTQGGTAQDEFDMVQVRIEPLVPFRVPCKEGEESVFGGQIFMLRHVQIEDKHFVQGFQLNEKELIGEVEESAQRFMRQGMNYELARQANGTSAYTAILDFGFGDLILNLIEIDPTRIARKISGMRAWYFSIITVVLLAVTLALASLWHNARAQLRLARKKDDFISAVSHELRTPLTSIRMYSEMLEKNWVKSKDKVAEYYKNMRQESERLTRLIENVLDFSRIQRGKKSYDFSLGDINKSIGNVVEMMRPYASQNGFTIETQLGEIAPTAFDADAVTQIVVNLLDNAVKYARDAEDKTLIVRTKGDREFIMIEVEDHGPGVPHRQRKKIFEEFYRIGAESTRETTGTGLGLALVKKFAQAHNGFVEIINARPKGAIFRVAIAAQTP